MGQNNAERQRTYRQRRTNRAHNADRTMEMLSLMIFFDRLNERYGDFDAWCTRRPNWDGQSGFGVPYDPHEDRNGDQRRDFEAFLEESAQILGRDPEGVKVVIGAAMPIIASNNSSGWWDSDYNLELATKARAAALAVGWIKRNHLPRLRLDEPYTPVKARNAAA